MCATGSGVDGDLCASSETGADGVGSAGGAFRARRESSGTAREAVLETGCAGSYGPRPTHSPHIQSDPEPTP